MKKIYFIFFILLISTSFSAWILGGDRNKEEPIGFRGNFWGADVSSLYLREYSRAVPKYKIGNATGKVVYYTKRNENLNIGGAKIHKIEYGYWNDEILCEIFITVKGEGNFERLKRAVFENFGPGFSSIENIWIWKGTKTKIKLEFDRNSETGYLFMSPASPGKFIQEYEKKLASQAHF